MIRARIRVITLAIAAAAVLGPASWAQVPELGKIEFPTSGTSVAQPHFIKGVLLLHSFEYSAAAKAFREAQDADPGFVMAYWGEAMTLNHPVWNEQDLEAAHAVLRRLAPTAAARRDRAPTDREKAYLDAIETLYGSGPKAARDTAYSSAMRLLAAAYPTDLEAQAFYALSLLGQSQGDRVIPTYMRAGAIAQEIFRRNPEHPGAAHYVIHSFDDPIHAPLGLVAARAYGRMAPDAAHAQHMTSHIFLALGLWDDVVAANEVASARENPLAATGKRRMPCGHYGNWLGYGYLQQGRFQEAGQVLMDCQKVAWERGRSAWRSVVIQYAAFVVNTGDWAMSVLGAGAPIDTASLDLAPSPDADHGNSAALDFLTGFAAAQQRDTAAASDALTRLVARAEGAVGTGQAYLGIMEHELRGLIDARTGHPESALTHLRHAVRIEDSLPIEFGPPRVAKPPLELLGEVFLELGRPAEAVEAFGAALNRTPRRALALLGLARAADRAGKRSVAQAAYNELGAVWRRADPGIPGLAEVVQSSTSGD